MLLVRLFAFLRGYVEVVVEGFFLERFINICTRRGIHLWNIRRTGKTRMSANMSIRAFRALPEIAYKTKCTARIYRRRGLPFFLHKYRKRKVFAFGVVLLAAVTYTLSLFVWAVDVTGNEKVETAVILEVLEKSGVKRGMRKGSVDTMYVRNDLVGSIPDVAWCSINIKGTRAEVEIKERADKPPLVADDKPCSVVAAADGVIENIQAYEGQQLVKNGDIVSKGQLLVSGAVETKYLGVRYVHADCEAYARTWHEETAEVPLYEEIRTRTNEAKSKHILEIFNFRVKFFINDSIPYANYDRISEVKNLTIGDSFVLPVALHYDKYYQVEVEQRPLDRETAVSRALQEKTAQMDARYKDIQIESKNHEVYEKDGKVYLKVTYECIENIALPLELDAEPGQSETADTNEN